MNLYQFGKRKNVVILFFLTLVLSPSCSDYDEVVPYVYVNQTISLTQYSELNTIGNSVEIPGGYQGIVIYRFSDTEFLAYDMACTYTEHKNCAIDKIEQGNPIYECECCGSKFVLTDGSISKGPAQYSLKPYNTRYDKTNRQVYIFN